MNLQCPHCGTAVAIPGVQSGAQVKCGACEQLFVTPQHQPIQHQQPQQHPQQQLQTSRGSTILCLGILGLFLIPILSPIAWILGSGDLKKMRNGIMDDHSADTTKIGYVFGVIGTILLLMIVIILIFGFLSIFLFSGSVDDLTPNTPSSNPASVGMCSLLSLLLLRKHHQRPVSPSTPV